MTSLIEQAREIALADMLASRARKGPESDFISTDAEVTAKYRSGEYDSLSNVRCALAGLESVNADLLEALRPFAALLLSTETEVSDCVLRTTAEELRRTAERLERRDAEILTARAAISLAEKSDA